MLSWSGCMHRQTHPSTNHLSPFAKKETHLAPSPTDRRLESGIPAFVGEGPTSANSCFTLAISHREVRPGQIRSGQVGSDLGQRPCLFCLLASPTQTNPFHGPPKPGSAQQPRKWRVGWLDSLEASLEIPWKMGHDRGHPLRCCLTAHPPQATASNLGPAPDSSAHTYKYCTLPCTPTGTCTTRVCTQYICTHMG